MAFSLTTANSTNPSLGPMAIPAVGLGGDPLAAARPYLEQVLAMTREVFGGQVFQKEQEDSEVTGDWMFVIGAFDGGSLDELHNRCSLWHSRLGELPTPARLFFCLSIDTCES